MNQLKMKIKLLKDFLTHKEGEVIERSKESGDHLVRCNIGVEVKEEELNPKAQDKPKVSKAKKDA